MPYGSGINVFPGAWSFYLTIMGIMFWLLTGTLHIFYVDYVDAFLDKSTEYGVIEQDIKEIKEKEPVWLD